MTIDELAKDFHKKTGLLVDPEQWNKIFGYVHQREIEARIEECRNFKIPSTHPTFKPYNFLIDERIADLEAQRKGGE